MWQDFKDFITIDNLLIFCFWFLILLTVVGLIEIIYQIRNAVRKINIADEYIKHIDIIQKHVAKRLHARKQYGFVDTKDLIEIAESLLFVEVNSDDAINSIAADHYISDPIYSLYSMLYHERWDDRVLPHIAIRYLLIMKKGERNFKRC